MKEFWINFYGSLRVKANSKEEAENKFRNAISEWADLPHDDLFDDEWYIEDIEEN